MIPIGYLSRVELVAVFLQIPLMMKDRCEAILAEPRGEEST
jgi:hypothetical protein